MTSYNATSDYAEKRDFIRMQVNASIDLKLVPDGPTYSAVCKNLSGMGMKLLAQQPLPVGTEVETALPSQSPELPTFRTTARVVRTEATDEGCLLGLEIIRIEQ